MLDDEGARIINLAVDLIIEESNGKFSRSQAIVELTRRFLHTK